MPKNLMDILDEHNSILISNCVFMDENRNVQIMPPDAPA